MPRSFIAILLITGALLLATAIPGAFITDENNYMVTVLALRQGQLSVPGTEGLYPSQELLYFDPMGSRRPVKATPVYPATPPLYSILALPFSFFGWRGLMALNTLAFLATSIMVFAYAQRYSENPETPWIAAAAFAFGGFNLEYAQGVWPQMLSSALCFAGVFAASRVRETGCLLTAACAGLATGFATGVRYQNILIAAGVGLGVFFWAPKRIRASAAYGTGLMLPLVACSIINHIRLGIWNPVSKGGNYISIADGSLSLQPFEHPWFEALQTFWVRIVDASVHPPFESGWAVFHSYIEKDPDTGAMVIIGEALRKSLLQSCPWVALALVLLIWVWIRKPLKNERANLEARALSISVFAVIALFSITGFNRQEGFCFNQRYLIELLPFCALAFAWATERTRLEWPLVLAGIVVGTVPLLFGFQYQATATPRQYIQLYVPLLLALLLILSWVPAATKRFGTRPLALLLVAAVTWGCVLHAGEGLRFSRQKRHELHAQLVGVSNALPDHSALFTDGPVRIAFGPIQLEKDVVIANVRDDNGRTANALTASLLREKRRVFILGPLFTPEIAAEISKQRLTKNFARIQIENQRDFFLIEILEPVSTPPKAQ